MSNVIGIDPHRMSVTAAVVGATGALVGTASFKANGEGFDRMLAWAAGFGPVDRCGVEGATGLGRHVSLFCEEHGLDVREVPALRISHPRSRRRCQGPGGKSDRLDAERVARHTLAHPGLHRPFKRSSGGGPDPVWECLQLLHAQRRSLTKTRTRLCNEADALLAALPEPVRDLVGVTGAVRPRLRRLHRVLSTGQTVITGDDPAGRLRIELLAEYTTQLASADASDRRLQQRIGQLVRGTGCTLTAICGVGECTAAQLLVEVGDPRRFRSASAFANFNGTAPIPASSGEGDGDPVRHRLNPGGNRRVNAALHRIAITQLRHDPQAGAIIDAARARGRTRREARRILKRRLSDAIWRCMINDANRNTAPDNQPLHAKDGTGSTWSAPPDERR